MKPSDVRALSEAQLDIQLNELHDEWRNLRFQEAIGRLTDTARIKKIRKDIARIKTIRGEREFEARIRAAQEAGR
jgi:large subunit ribosomal protein L29